MHAQGMIIPTFWESVHLGWLSAICLKRAKKISAPYTFRPTFSKDLPLFYEHNIVCFSVPTQSGQRKFKIEVVPNSVISKHIDVVEFFSAAIVILEIIIPFSPQQCYNP